MSAPEKEGTFQACGFGLDKRLLKALARLGFVYPTLVQSKAIPLALEGKDLLVRARTGSGKTAAFGLPLLHKILTRKADNPPAKLGVLAVILVPTKELCDQTYRVLSDLSYFCRDTVTIQGLVGDNISAQQALLRDSPDVLVATPARLLAHLKAGNVKLKESVETFVMDEADLILSFGYDDDVKAVVASLPRIYQGMLMSATLSPELESLKRVVLHSPATLKLEEGQSDGELLQFFVALPEQDKYLLIFVFLKLGVLEGKGLFFVNSLDACYRLKLFLEQFSIRSAVLNAELPLNSRLHTIQEYNRGIFDFLIATDESMDACGGASSDSEDEEEGGGEEEEVVEGDDDQGEDDDGDDEEEDDDGTSEDEEEGDAGAEDGAEEGEGDGEEHKKRKSRKRGRGQDKEYGVHRGIDFKAVSFVLNVDFPVSAKSYTHRIGRTARGGANGTALSLVDRASAAELAVLYEVQASQPALPPIDGEEALTADPSAADALNNSAPLRAQPAPLAFDLKELEGFRYRVEDVKRAVTRVAVREARLAEIKQEMLNSEALQSYFEENPHEFQVLRHDKAILPSNQVRQHLKHVPDYLLPQGMRVGADPAAKKRKRRRGGRKRDRLRRKDNDPLQSFEGPKGGDEDGEADDGGGHSDGSDGEDPIAEKGDEDRIFGEGEFIGESSAGRVRWKQAHKKGKFSGKPKPERKKRRL